MHTFEEIAGWMGRDLYDPCGERIGRIDGVRADRRTGAPEWLTVALGDGDGPALVIGDGTKIVGGSVFSAASSIRIGSKVLMARNAYIADHQHAFSDTSRAVLDQGIERVAPVEIGDGAWLGENVVVGPGVTIGRGSVIGANSVVLRDVPEYSVAVGTPARVVRRLVDDV